MSGEQVTVVGIDESESSKEALLCECEEYYFNCSLPQRNIIYQNTLCIL